MTERNILYMLLLLILANIGVAKFQRLTTPFRFLAILLIYTFVSEMVSFYTTATYGSNLSVCHLFVWVQFAFLSLVYAKIFGWGVRTGLIITALFLLVSCCNIFFLQSIRKFPSNTAMLSSCFFITISLFYFKRLLQHVERENILKRSVFWFNAAILIYFSLAFWYWGIYNHMLNHKITTAPVTTIIYYLNILFYFMILLALLFDTAADNRNPDE